MPARQRAVSAVIDTLTPAQIPPSAMTEIKRLGYEFSEMSQFDLELLSNDRRVQVREVRNYAPKDAVQRYAVQMGQSQFPPIIVTKDFWLIDGNTRVGAALLRDMKFFPAIILDVEYAGRSTTSKTQRELRALAMTLNSSHGQPLTAKEARDGVRDLIDLGWRADQIARAIGLKAAAVGQVRKEIAAENKLKAVGFSGSLSGAALRALGGKDPQALVHAPFLGLATLAAKAGFTGTEIATAAKDLRDVGSEAGQVEKLEALTTEFGDRIRERELTGKGKPAPSRQLRQHLGYVTKFGLATAHELLETDPACFGLAMDALDKSIPILISLRNMQRPPDAPEKTDWTKDLAS